MITTHDMDRIVKAFDFERVKKVMNALDWKYGSGDPVTVDELKNMAWTLYEGFFNWNTLERCSSQSGGFTIRKAHGADYLTLSFCVETQDSQKFDEEGYFK